MYENARKYNLTGTDAMVFEALVSLCKKTGSWKGSFATLARYSCCGGKTTAYYVLERLISKGLVFKNGTGAFQIGTETFNNGTISKEERTKEENIKEKKSKSVIKMTSSDKGRTDGLSSFDSFWKKYNPQVCYNNRKKACRQLFEQMPESWQQLACEMAENHAPDTNPFFWLQDETFLRVGNEKMDKCENEKITWLSPEQQFECLQKDIALAVVYNPETDSYPTTTLQIATERGLKIHRKILC